MQNYHSIRFSGYSCHVIACGYSKRNESQRLEPPNDLEVITMANVTHFPTINILHSMPRICHDQFSTNQIDPIKLMVKVGPNTYLNRKNVLRIWYRRRIH